MNILGWKFYIKPFKDNGDYNEWIDVTPDIEKSSLGNISQQLDNTQFNVGIYRNSSINISLRNESGRYSDVDDIRSIFRWKRSNSLVKITYQVEEEGPICGDAVLGDAYLSDEVDVFVGLLSDESLSMDIAKRSLTFQVLGLESILDRVTVPTDDLESKSTLAEIILKLLNQTEITKVLGISESNIQLGANVSTDAQFEAIAQIQDILFMSVPRGSEGEKISIEYKNMLGDGSAQVQAVVDNKVVIHIQSGVTTASAIAIAVSASLRGLVTALVDTGKESTAQVATDGAIKLEGYNPSTLAETTTVKDAIDEILKITNSVMFVKDMQLMVVPRDPSPDLKKTFHGQGSESAPEDIVNITEIRNGLSKTFNYLTWGNSELLVKDFFSVKRHGVRKLEFESDLVTDVEGQAELLESILQEFSNPRMQFNLVVPVNFKNLALEILDRVAVNYPKVYMPSDSPPPICGQMVCGQAVLPAALWNFSISESRRFKIIGRSISMNKGEITFTVREIPSGS